MSMRFRDQPEDMDPATEVSGATQTAAARVDFELLRRLEFESNQSPNGVFRLHPRAARVQPNPAAVPEESEPEPVVRLVSPWPGNEAEEIDDEEDDQLSKSVVPVTEDPRAEPVARMPAKDTRIPKVIVVDRAGRLAVDLGKAAEGLDPEPEVLKLDRPTEIVEVAASEDPDVIVFGLEEVNGAGLKRLAQVHKAQPKIVIVLSDNRRKTWTAAQMAASGASDFLPANPTRARLKTKLTAALATAEQLRVESVVVTERVVVQDPPVEVPKVGRAPASLARVFTVASASGGSGKTVVATNLAAYLVKATGSRVLLVDLDLQFGEVAPSLHLHPQRTIEDLLLDPEELSDALVEHTAGFKALCAPTDALAAERIGPDEVMAVLEVARLEFDYIVVDTPPALNETCLAVFDQSEKVILTANMDVPSLKNMRRYLETIEKLDVPAHKAVLLVNRSDSGIGLDLQGVGQLFPQGFLTVLPVSREVPWATNMGLPILEAKPKSEISRHLAEGFVKLVPPYPGVVVPWIPVAQSSRRVGLLAGRKKSQD